MKQMTTTLDPPEQRIVLNNVTWDLYEGLLIANRECSAPRFTYDNGYLEIMSPSVEHEQLKDSVVQLVHIFAEEKRISIKGFGSTTFLREDLAKGFEPDACFYSANLSRVRGKTKLDLRVDPPPDLAIEIDITRSSLDKLSIMAQIGVPELWRCHRNTWRILRLAPTGYSDETESAVLPGLDIEMISTVLEESRTLDPLEWMRRVRERVRES